MGGSQGAWCIGTGTEAETGKGEGERGSRERVREDEREEVKVEGRGGVEGMWRALLLILYHFVLYCTYY